MVQVSEVYQTIEFAHLAKLAPFTDNFRLERIIVDAAKTLDLPVLSSLYYRSFYDCAGLETWFKALFFLFFKLHTSGF